MIHMNEALIVEGRYDKSKLSALTDAIIVTTNGFGIYKDAEKRDFIRKLAKERGIVILKFTTRISRIFTAKKSAKRRLPKKASSAWRAFPRKFYWKF